MSHLGPGTGGTDTLPPSGCILQSRGGGGTGQMTGTLQATTPGDHGPLGLSLSLVVSGSFGDGKRQE